MDFAFISALSVPLLGSNRPVSSALPAGLFCGLRVSQTFHGHPSPHHHHPRGLPSMRSGSRPRPMSDGPSPSPEPVPVPPALESLRVVGLGSCGMDMLAYVSAFPIPDAKIRTTHALHAGGGNCANTLTGMRRLGLPCALVTLLGDDPPGRAAREELVRDGIDTSAVALVPGINTPFTYVLVDERTQSRTCIHTPSQRELILEEDVPNGFAKNADRGADFSDAKSGTGDAMDENVRITRRPFASVNDPYAALLRGATLVHLDGRHTAAACTLAAAANAAGVPVLLDVERDRPLLSSLIPLADYIVTNSTYPLVFVPEAANKLDAMARILACGRARFVISTGGSTGATLVARVADAPRGHQDSQILVTRELVCLPGLEATLGDVVVLQCPSLPVKKVVDTTGAGDAFIAGIGYGLSVGLGLETMMALAARIAASKIQKPGARAGLPRRDELELELLSGMPRL